MGRVEFWPNVKKEKALIGNISQTISKEDF